MHLRVRYLPCADRSTIPGLTLLGLWFAGVSLGLWAARFYGEQMGPMALAAGRAELTFWNACVVTVLPLFLSAFAVFFFHRMGAYLAGLLRGCLVGLPLGCAMAAGGLWLGLLLLFSAVAVSPVILWFLRRRLRLGPDGAGQDLLYALGAALTVTAVDHWAVAPFLAHALSF